MKKIISILTLAVLITSCASYNRIGDLTMISNRNIDSSKEYVLIKRNVEGIAKAENNDALERAIDKITDENKGEYLMNIRVYVKSNGKKVKIRGDVWGLKSTKTNISSSVTKKIEFKTGDEVMFKKSGSLKKGKIIGINENGAIVEYKGVFGKITQKEVKFDNLTKIDK